MIQEIITCFQDSLRALGRKAEPESLESWTVLIFEAMASKQRNFHTPEHVLGIAREIGPLESLAILFHDIVNVQVDGGVTPAVEKIISRYVSEQDGNFTVRRLTAEDDRRGWLVLSVFGFEPGHRPTISGGLNELLSALVAANKLGDVLSEKQIIQVAACIEATIPFRKANENNETSIEVLSKRLAALNVDMNLGFSESEMEETLRMAVSLANKDQESFVDEDVGRFLDNAWRLMPETNPALRNPNLYTIREYRIALHRIEAFLSMLEPETIFHNLPGAVESEEMEMKKAKAAININISVKYLRVKLVTVAILEALAELTGGNAPISLFMGSVPTKGSLETRLEDFLPMPGDRRDSGDENVMILNLLEIGRASESSYDLKSSPLSAFLYKKLGEGTVMETFEKARLMFDGRLRPQQFLDFVDPWIVSVIAEAAMNTAITRKSRLKELSAAYKGARHH